MHMLEIRKLEIFPGGNVSEDELHYISATAEEGTRSQCTEILWRQIPIQSKEMCALSLGSHKKQWTALQSPSPLANYIFICLFFNINVSILI